MKITTIEPIELVIPWIERVREPMSAHMSGAERTFVYKIFTDEGIVGVGEGGDHRNNLDSYVGKDPFDFIMGNDPEPLQEALYDIMGKALGKPAHVLLGQKCRDRVKAAFWSIDMSPEQAANEAIAAVEGGYLVHKLKVRPWVDFVAQAQQIFSVVPPEYRLRPDNNGHRYPEYFTVGRILYFARMLESFWELFDYFEGPIKDNDLNDLAYLRNNLRIPISVHASPEWAASCCKMEACDFFQVGGPVSTITKVAHVAEAAGHRAVTVELAGGGAGAGINTVWAAHIAAVLPNATKAICTVPDLRVATVVAEPLRPKKGWVTVPDAPGLGLELDEDVIAHYRVQ